MGTKIAPTCTTLTLADLEENLYEIVSKYGHRIKEEFTKSLKIYLDNWFMFWKCPWGDINDLLNQQQTLHPQKKFTIEHSWKQQSCLDIFIKK